MAERKVPVCSACKRACCFQGAFLCSDAGKAGTVELPVEALRKLGLEHPGYWRDNPGQNDEDIVELAEWAKAQAIDPGMFVAYHVSELGFDPERVYRLLKDVWPEAAAKVHFES